MTEVKFPSMVDMPDKEYFAHPAIDQTGLKKFMELQERTHGTS